MQKILFIIVFLFSAMLFSQHQGGIKGTITNVAMNNEPMLFANVQLKGSDVSYQTNFHGNYEISDIDAGEYTLVISYAGYETEELNIVVQENKVSKIETNLSPMQISFDDVVGMEDTALEEKVLPTNEEKTPRK